MNFRDSLPFVQFIDLPQQDSADAEVTVIERASVRECGAAGFMCHALCFSVALTQSPNAAPLLRRLTCAALLSKFNELNILRQTEEGYLAFDTAQSADADDLFLGIIKDEIDILKIYGNDASYIGIHALSASLGIRAANGQTKA